MGLGTSRLMLQLYHETQDNVLLLSHLAHMINGFRCFGVSMCVQYHFIHQMLVEIPIHVCVWWRRRRRRRSRKRRRERREKGGGGKREEEKGGGEKERR